MDVKSIIVLQIGLLFPVKFFAKTAKYNKNV
jgi:hypothetical protein